MLGIRNEQTDGRMDKAIPMYYTKSAQNNRMKLFSFHFVPVLEAAPVTVHTVMLSFESRNPYESLQV